MGLGSFSPTLRANTGGIVIVVRVEWTSCEFEVNYIDLHNFHWAEMSIQSWVTFTIHVHPCGVLT